MALQLDPYGRLGKPDREMAGFVASHIKDVMTDRYVLADRSLSIPTEINGAKLVILDPWWPTYDRSKALLGRMVRWSVAGALLLPVLASCVAALR